MKITVDTVDDAMQEGSWTTVEEFTFPPRADRTAEEVAAREKANQLEPSESN